MGAPPLHVLVIGGHEDDYVFTAAEQLREGLEQITVVESVGLPDLCEEDECAVPVVVMSPHVGRVDEVMQRLRTVASLRRAGLVLLTDQTVHDDLAQAVDSGVLKSVVAVPWTPPSLIEQVNAVVQRWLQKWYPEAELTHTLAGMEPDGGVRGGDLLYGLDSPREHVQRVLLEGIEKHLGPRPRMVVPAGVNLTRQNERVDAVYLVLRGSVALRRSSHFGDVLLHHATSGPLIGLVSMARQQRALFTSTTTTEVEMVRLSWEQLEYVLTKSPDTSANLAVVAIQALTSRLVRAEYLHVEKNELAEQLELERERLTQTLEELTATRAQLVEQTKYAMLGELSAGIAHELNNPVAALQRATQQIGDELDTLLHAIPELEDAAGVMERTRNVEARSTAQERELVRQVMELTGDRQVAKQLVGAELTDPVQVKALLRKEKSHRRLHRRGKLSPISVVEAAAHIGKAVRNSTVAARRITDLVASLRAYARPDSEPSVDVDVHAGIEDVLRLTSHRLRGVEIEREYEDIARIRAYPTRLEQVWTNLLVNAREAFEDEDDALEEGQLPARGEAPARLRIVTCQPDEEWVQVSICDNGPGIPQHLRERILEPHFTTKGGQVRFGLGMGMSITSSIVDDHDGEMVIDSAPGSTVITVRLPVRGPSEQTLLDESSPTPIDEENQQ
ncbi:MAG: ATP-binding protein [Actinomycetaceae bacterium]|nr:ATP-binding protein [Actinomycetaceae bacterium]